MKPSEILEQAKASPIKRGLHSYLETIWVLRRKGNTFRQIADFLNARGVETDHTAVYRLIEADKPDFNYQDDCILINGLPYECRSGRPLLPFDAGMVIHIRKRLQILRLNEPETDRTIWCEAQFELNAAPNYLWLKTLAKLLDIDFKPKTPWHLRGKHGIELKFDGKLMAMVFRSSDLEQAVKEVETAANNATQFFIQDRDKYSARSRQLVTESNAREMERIQIQPGESMEEAIQAYRDRKDKQMAELTKRFRDCPRA